MIVVFGSINLDLIFAVEALPAPGQTVAAPALRTEPGGKGANQALAAARDGATVVFAGAVGEDAFAEPALRLLRAEGVDLARVRRVAGATGVAAICVDAGGENLIAVASGANLAVQAEQVEDALLGPGTTLLVQMEVDAAETAALVRRARARGARVVLNLAPAGTMAGDALRALDVLVVNEAEAAWQAGRLGVPAEAAAMRGTLGIDVVLTLGSRGVAAATATGAIVLPAHPVAVVDTTAAGDCFAGVLAAGLDRGLAMAAALARANAAAALCCGKAGSQASLPHGPETDAAVARGMQHRD